MTRSRSGTRPWRRTTPSTTRVDTGADARGPACWSWGRRSRRAGPDRGGTRARIRRVRQTLHDPEGHHDWVLEGSSTATPPTRRASWSSAVVAPEAAVTASLSWAVPGPALELLGEVRWRGTGFPASGSRRC